MTVTPRYVFPEGSEVTLLSRKLVLIGRNENGYETVDLEDGNVSSIPFAKFVEYCSLPGAKIDVAVAQTGSRLQTRLGGYASAKSLPDDQRDVGKFHHALCLAMEAYRAHLREESGNPRFELSHRLMNKRSGRLFVKNIAEQILGHKVHIEQPRGGHSKVWVLYRGRTLVKHFNAFLDLAPDEHPLDALIPLYHLKGNRTDRLSLRVRELMTEAWEKYGLDRKKPSPSNVMAELEALISQENAKRARNELPPLRVPSQKALIDHRLMLLTETEYAIAVEGKDVTRNKKGRGSTDIRALFIGEYVEVDECKASLVNSAKEAGFWERMSEDQRRALEEIDEYIRTRLFVLVMIDVATRMPLAWVISDAPKAEATLALFRMATRNKTREKQRYGCSGDPVGAVGILHVKNDNGPGLRNSTVIGAYMGVGAINTLARTYSATDKPHVERLFGTQESEFFKLIHGYTGRRPGELPGYDAQEYGVLDVDQLYRMVTRYLIEEYPSNRHMGVGMYGRRPYEAYRQINEARGHVALIDPNMRRIQLGWCDEVTPTDEGVRIFQGIFYNSDELQQKREEYGIKGKVQVYVDPDDASRATVLMPNVKDPIEVSLQITAFADMTIPEILNLMERMRKETPEVTQIHEDRVQRTRLQRREELEAIGVEHKLPRSYSTIAECRAKAKAVFAGARVLPSELPAGTTRPGAITDLAASEGVISIGAADRVIEGSAYEVQPHAPLETASVAVINASPEPGFQSEQPTPRQTATPARKPKMDKKDTDLLPRPKNLKGLE